MEQALFTVPLESKIKLRQPDGSVAVFTVVGHWYYRELNKPLERRYVLSDSTGKAMVDAFRVEEEAL